MDLSGSRSVICSIPKSGTYLLSEILSNLGIRKSNWHVSKEELSDYSCGSREDHRKHPEEFRVVRPYEKSIALLPAHSHLVSHLPCEPDICAVCRREGVKVFFLYRDLRDCAISYMRFLADTGRDRCEQSDWLRCEDGPARFAAFLRTYDWFFPSAATLTPWRRRPEVLPVEFETLVGDRGIVKQTAILKQIRAHLTVDAAVADLPAVFRRSFTAPTLTWSGRRTERALYWSAEVQRLFEETGGAQANTELGYEERGGSLARAAS